VTFCSIIIRNVNHHERELITHGILFRAARIRQVNTSLLLFLGTAKTFGVLAVLAPGVSRIKEWAFAGLTFDVSGALYSHLSVGDSPSGWAPAVVALLLVVDRTWRIGCV
jgi:hypothetical protein